MSKLAINVNIGSRVYPLTITREEEELIRAAAKRVNENMKQLESTYDVKDKQDLLAMTSLYFANKMLALESQNKGDTIQSTDALNEVAADLMQYLQQID